MRNNLITRIFVIGLLATAWASAPAQVVKQGNGFLLRMKYTKGAIAKYTMTTTSVASAGIPAMNMAMPMETKVLSVLKGVGEVQYTVGPVTNNGKAMGQKQVVVTKVDARGKMLSSSGMAQQFNNVTFPEGAINPGASWSGVQSSQSAMGAMNMNATYTFVGLKSIGGKMCAEIKVAVSGGNAMIKTNGTGSVFLLVSDGSLQSTHLAQDMRMDTGQKGAKPMQLKMIVKITRK